MQVSTANGKLEHSLVSRVQRLLSASARSILGIAGSPGSGKSTIAELVSNEFGDTAVVVPMDGFHLAQEELVRLGRAEQKGAPDTFDVNGYTALLSRLRCQSTHEIVYAPRFRREIEEPVAGAIAVYPNARLIITEGNYLLFDGAWSAVRPLLDESWFVSTPEEQRDNWLLARHISFGRSREEAAAWIKNTDAPNAIAIEAKRHLATITVENVSI
jgi:pantothenate kinase